MDDTRTSTENFAYGLTEHVIQRYSERVKDKDELITTDLKERYSNEIKLLFLSSIRVYTGKVGKGQNSNMGVYCNKHGWVFITDESPKNKVLVTLYKVDLNVDSDELNQLYVDKAISKIQKLSTEYESLLFEVEDEKEKYTKEISQLTDKIQEYKQIIKTLEARVSSLRNDILTAGSTASVAEFELKSAVEDYIIKDKTKLLDASTK